MRDVCDTLQAKLYDKYDVAVSNDEEAVLIETYFGAN